MEITVLSPDQQAVGSFDNGKITEQKPIGFPGEGSAVKRVGPLFYWSWAEAKQEGYIAPHPHQAFEIITYVIEGKAEHGDSLGTKSVVSAGGLQVMQTGSGVHHEERFIGPEMEGFQIWFEPYIREALQRTPTYNQYEHNEFPQTEADGAVIKTVIGKDSPVDLVADVNMWELKLSAGQAFQHTIPAGYTLNALTIRGNGKWVEEEQSVNFSHKDFVLLKADNDTTVTIHSDEGEELRMIWIQVPTKVDYPLYPSA